MEPGFLCCLGSPLPRSWAKSSPEAIKGFGRSPHVGLINRRMMFHCSITPTLVETERGMLGQSPAKSYGLYEINKSELGRAGKRCDSIERGRRLKARNTFL